MARLLVDGDDLVMGLAWWEKLIARHGDVRVPLAAVEQVSIQPDWWRALRGIRVRTRALAVPGALCVGVWRHGEGQDFLALRRPRRSPTVVVDLRTEAPYARIAVSCPPGSQTVSAINTALHRQRREKAREEARGDTCGETYEEAHGDTCGDTCGDSEAVADRSVRDGPRSRPASFPPAADARTRHDAGSPDQPFRDGPGECPRVP
ncbi:hypothetical protein ACFWJW_08745 [Streptomyces sp. NPDC127097]|uniref:hypothetical protein n=1 Tax=Streptomyces sp. NPDC127097 TaxID=3347136 RepID=UPI00364D28E4